MTLRRLLAVTHEATITGAPMNLAHLLRWMATERDVEIHTLVVHDGPLRSRFEEVGEVTVLDRNRLTSLLGVVHHGLVHLGSRRAWRPAAAAHLLPQLRHLRGFDLTYLNSLTSVGVLPYLPPTPRVVSHVHELQVAVRTFLELDRDRLLLTRPDRWIAASGAVRDLLVDEMELPEERVLLHHEFIEAKAVAQAAIEPREIERRRREAGVPSDAAVVMGAGTIDWRKGADLFVQLATEVRRRSRQSIHFVWVGGDLEGVEWERLRSDIERSGADHVHFVGTKPKPLPWFAMADVFALTSHEDPFPLVCLEHAALGHPVVTYENGGMVELLRAAGPEAARGIVPHLDVGTMADRIIDLLGSPTLGLAAGDQLRSRVLEVHDVAAAAPRLHADLSALVDSP